MSRILTIIVVAAAFAAAAVAAVKLPGLVVGEGSPASVPRLVSVAPDSRLTIVFRWRGGIRRQMSQAVRTSPMGPARRKARSRATARA